MAILELTVASGEALSVRRFEVKEGMSSLFTVSLVARSENSDVDLQGIVGRPAAFRIVSGAQFLKVSGRIWTGICSAMKQVRVEPTGLSTYELTLVPALWLLTQRRNNRLFQHVSIPEIVGRILDEWHIQPIWRIDAERYPRLELRAQYGESDHAFISRLLEEAGITYLFADDPERGSQLVLHDAPQVEPERAGGPIAFVDETFQVQAAELEFLTEVHLGEEVRPGRHTIRDFDFRRPRLELFSQAAPAGAPEDGYEQYHHAPGSFLIETNREPAQAAAALAAAGRVAAAAERLGAAARGPGGEGAGPIDIAGEGTPVADDKGVARFEQAHGTGLAARSLEALRASKRRVQFRTNAPDLRPGVVFRMGGHPRADLADSQKLLAVEASLEGTPGGEWVFRGAALFAAEPYRPAMQTDKPRIYGVQSALVVGPQGEEIYTDEFGRVRVQFHWDREGKYDDRSSIWMRVSQGWAGGGYGLFTIPRVGHEVLVAFLDGDPDNPIVVGRVFNGASQVPHKLPANKTVSTWKTSSSPGGEGFNELRFEDAAGREMIFEHAQKDKNQLVKNDERCGVGRNRTRTVKQNETIAIGGSRTEAVALDQVEAIGLTQTTAIGLNRNTTVGVDDATLVGSKFSVTMARGLTGTLSKKLGELMSGPFGALLRGPVEAVLGVVPNLPLGALGAMSQGNPEGPLSVLHAIAPGAVRSLTELLEDLRDEPGPPPTSIEMVDRKITLTTGEASIILEGPNITLLADGNIMLHARQNAGVLADGEVAVAAEKKALLLSKSDDAIVQGGPDAHLNPFDIAAKPDAPAVRAPYHEVLEDEEERCEECGEPLAAAMPGSPLAHRSTREDGKVCSRVARRSERWDLPLTGWEKELLQNIKRGTAGGS